MPNEAKFLYLSYSDWNGPELFYLADPTQFPITVNYQIVRAGEMVMPNWQHRGSFTSQGGQTAHVFRTS